MFRKMRRFKQQLTDEQCIHILKTEKRGVLSVMGEDGYPYGVPMNFIYDDGKIYFHGAKEGHKIDALKANPKVSFCTYTKGVQNPKKIGLDVQSVIVFGHINFVDDPEKIKDQLYKIGYKYNPPETVAPEVERTLKRTQILELTIDHMTGKQINES